MASLKKLSEACPNLPWCSDDIDKLGSLVMQHTRDEEIFHKRWAQKWFQNFQFIYGNQHLKWSRRYDFAVNTDFLKRENSINQRSQTNITREIAESLASLIYSDVPTWEAITPEESHGQGKRYKEIYEKILSYHDETLKMGRQYWNASMIFVAYSQVATRVDWDNSAGRVVEVPQYEIKKMPVNSDWMAPNDPFGLLEVPTEALNSSGEPILEERLVPIRDANGQIVTKRTWAGKPTVTVLTPFEYRRSPGSTGMHDTKYVRHIMLMDYDEWLKKYENMDGKTKLFGNVRPGRMGRDVFEFAFAQFMKMMFSTPLEGSAFGREFQVFSRNTFKNKVLVIEHFDKPHEQYWPNGRRLVISNGYCTHYTDPQYTTNKEDGWHPFAEAQWLSLKPCQNSAGSLDDVVQKNKELNVADSLILTSMLRTMGSSLLVKTGEIAAEQMTGTPGQILEVRDPNSAARWLNDPQPIPPALAQIRDSKKSDAYDTSGAGEAIRGERSKGMSSGYQYKQQQEREEKRLSPQRRAFEDLVGTTGEKLVSCVRTQVPKLGPDMIGYLKRNAAGRFSEQDILAFTRLPIDYGAEIKVKKDSMAYKSIATQQATILELISKTPAGQRVANDAKVLDAVLKFFDADVLRDASALQRERAGRENEAFSDLGRLGPNGSGINIPVVLFEDDDNIHIAEHTDDLVAKADELTGNLFEMELRLFHLEQHRMQQKEKAGEVVPGSTATMSTQFQNAKQTKPDANQVYPAQQQRQQAKAAQPPPPQGPQAGVPRVGKSGPAQPGPAPIDPNAPSSLTPGALSQGGGI